MSRKKNRRGKSKLEKKVLKFQPLRDHDNRRYVPFCDYGWHQGIIKYPSICEKRRCIHYYRFYLDSNKESWAGIPGVKMSDPATHPQCNY